MEANLTAQFFPRKAAAGSGLGEKTVVMKLDWAAVAGN